MQTTSPSLQSLEATVGRKFVVLSADQNPIYLWQLPIVAWLWRNYIGYTPIVYIIVPSTPAKASSMLAKIIQYLKHIGCNVATVPSGYAGFKLNSNLAQNIRIFSAQLHQHLLKPNDYLLISDAEMYPLSPSYFNQQPDWTKKFHIYNTHGMSAKYGNYDELEYPMCYLGGYVSTWLEILGDRRLANSAGLLDQPYITKLIKAWETASQQPHPHTIHRMYRKLDPSIRLQFHMRYQDRIDKVAWRSYQTGDVDAHVFKSVEQDKLVKCQNLVAELGVKSDFLDEYFTYILRLSQQRSNADKNIFVYWAGGGRPAYLDLCLQTIRQHAVGFQIIVLSPDTILKFFESAMIKPHPKWADIVNYSHQADYFRILAVYNFGGFWFDIDTVLLNTVDDWWSKLESGQTDDNNNHQQNIPDYNLVWAGPALFAAKRGNLYLQRYIEGLHQLFDQTLSTQPTRYGWTQFYDTIGHPLMDQMVQDGSLKVYRIPESDLHPLIKIPWNLDNLNTGYLAPAHKFKNYFNPTQRVAVLHNSLYPISFKQLTRQQVLDSDTMLAQYFKYSLGRNG